ncbi:MAG: ABC transporter substrate-binding protein, partial [Flavobacteriales bacterium]
MERASIFWPLLCLFLFILSGCGGGGGNSQDPVVFRYNESGGISSLDPAFSRNVENIWAVHQLFNGLVRMNSNLKVVGDIAKDWELNEKGTVYTFHLRDSVLFHEHKAFSNPSQRIVTAADFEYSFERIMKEETASPGAYIFDKLRDNAEKGVKALNDSTLRIELEKTFPPFLGLLTMKYCSVVPEEVVNSLGKERFGREPIGTGPFRFKHWESGVKLLFAKNPDYFEKDDKGRQLPYLDGVSISFMKDRHTAFMEFKQGKFDYLSGVDGSFKEEVLNEKGKLRKEYRTDFELRKGAYLKTDYLGILVDSTVKGMKGHPLTDPLVRRAMNLAIDRKALVRHIRMDVGTPALYGFIPDGLPSRGKEAFEALGSNRDKARRLLRKAGYPHGKGIPPIKLSTTENYTDICEFVLNQLGKIGIEVNMNVVPPSNHRDHVAHSRFKFFRKSWVADYPDGQNFLSLFYSGNFSPEGPNYTHFRNARFDSLYEAAMKESDRKERRKMYRKMDRIIVKKAPVIPLFYDQILRLVKKEVKGLKENPM